MTSEGDRFGASQSQFSLQQLEGARASVSSGAPSVGIIARNGVVIATGDELQSPLFDVDSVRRIELISEHIGMVYSGIPADFRLLVKEARKMDQTHFVSFQQPISVSFLVKKLGALVQAYTQNNVVRPFGVSVLICGWGEGRPLLYVCDPSGATGACLTAAIGKHAAQNNAFLEESNNTGLDLKDAVHKALLTLKNGFEGKFTAEKIEVGICDSEGFQRLSIDEIEAYLKKIAKHKFPLSLCM